MLYRVLAETILVFHLAFILFVVAGGLLALRWRWVPLVHVPAAAWGIYIELSSSICPLTPLENWLRFAAGEAGYSGGFVEQYITPVIYPIGLTDPTQIVFAGVVVLANLLVYTVVWRRYRRARHTSDT